MGTTNTLLECIRRQERDALRLQRKLGRMAYWRNTHRKERDELRRELDDVTASKHGQARSLGKAQKRIEELEATVAELQASLNGKLAGEVHHA